MEISINQVRVGLVKIQLTGRLDIAGTGLAEKPILNLIENTNSDILIDLSATVYITSIGIGILVRTANELKQKKRKLLLFKPKPLVLRVLQATKIDKVIPIAYDTDAIKELLEKNGEEIM